MKWEIEMNKVKLAVSLALLMLGLASWDAVLDHEQDLQDSAITAPPSGQARVFADGTPRPD